MPEQPIATASDLATYQSGDGDLMVVAAQALVRSYCRWHIYPERTETLVVDGSGGVVQPLPTLHLTEVASVTETTIISSNAETSTVLALDEHFDWSESGYLTRLGGWRWTAKLRGVSAVVTHGYTEVPPEVQAVVLSVASRAVDGAEGGGLDTIGPYRYAPAKNADGSVGGVTLSELEKAVLDRYRVPVAP